MNIGRLLSADQIMDDKWLGIEVILKFFDRCIDRNTNIKLISVKQSHSFFLDYLNI